MERHQPSQEFPTLQSSDTNTTGPLPHIQPHLSKLLNPLKGAHGATGNENKGRFRPESWTSLGGNDLREDEALGFIEHLTI